MSSVNLLRVNLTNLELRNRINLIHVGKLCVCLSEKCFSKRFILMNQAVCQRLQGHQPLIRRNLKK